MNHLKKNNNEKALKIKGIFKWICKKAKAFLRKLLRFFKEYFIGGSSDKPFSRKKRFFFGLFTFFLFVASIAVFIAVFTLKIYDTDTKNADFNKNVAAVCSNLITETGTSRVERLDNADIENNWQMLGVSLVRRVDFNADGNDEFLIAYCKSGKYYVEVWGNNGEEFVSFYKEEANSLKDYSDLGSWLTIYHNDGKYYIGKLIEESEDDKENKDNEDNENSKDSKENMTLLALHGSAFKEESRCTFEPETAFYLFDEEIDYTHFETIQFSALASAKAEYQLNTVHDGLLQFISERAASDNLPKTEDQKKASAYSKIINDRIKKFGETQLSTVGSSVFVTGAAVVQLVDFNGDGNSELMIMSRNKKDYNDTDAFPKYLTEVFNWDGNSAKKIYEGATTSTYFSNSKTDIFYILQKKDSKTNICFNTYSFGENPDLSWRGLSTIVEMADNESFETAFTAYKRNNYDYISYKLDGEYASKRRFNEVGYTVPYFCNDDDYDKNQFSISVLKCDESKKVDVEKVMKNTEEVIKQINTGSAK